MSDTILFYLLIFPVKYMYFLFSQHIQYVLTLYIYIHIRMYKWIFSTTHIIWYSNPKCSRQMKHEIKNVGRSCQYPIVFIRCTKRMSMEGNVTDFLFIIKKFLIGLKFFVINIIILKRLCKSMVTILTLHFIFSFIFFLTMIIRFS